MAEVRVVFFLLPAFLPEPMEPWSLSSVRSPISTEQWFGVAHRCAKMPCSRTWNQGWLWSQACDGVTPICLPQGWLSVPLGVPEGLCASVLPGTDGWSLTLTLAVQGYQSGALPLTSPCECRVAGLAQQITNPFMSSFFQSFNKHLLGDSCMPSVDLISEIESEKKYRWMDRELSNAVGYKNKWNTAMLSKWPQVIK